MAIQFLILLLILCPLSLCAENLQIKGLKEPVEILRDRWGVPHIFAKNQDDMFFANGYMNARDRLFQIDLWRRIGTGRLAEAAGSQAVGRDRMARLFRFRGDWKAEWTSYAPDTYNIAVAFTNGINAYIRSLVGKRPPEFEAGGYDPALWAPEDILARIGALSISQNVTREVTRAQDIAQLGLEKALRLSPPQPPVTVIAPPGINLSDINHDVVRDLTMMLATPPFGSNNWAIDGSRSLTGKPLLASDPHRGMGIPSLRRTIHLVSPGWDIIGASEPALPGISLGHNEQIAFGFTITGTDQQDLYVEKLNPKNADEYWNAGTWKQVTLIREKVGVKNGISSNVELRFTVHGPIIYEDRAHNVAYALRWVGMEPGGAGYLGTLSVARAKNWNEFKAASARFKAPSENMVYADRAGNIGFIVAGLVPIRKNWTGLLPIPGTGEYEWSGFLNVDQVPQLFNPARHFIATANNNILPDGYKGGAIAYDWGSPYRVQRIEELLSQPKKFSAADFQQMQYDIVSLPARRFQAAMRRWKPRLTGNSAMMWQRILAWDTRMTADSVPGLVWELWIAKLPLVLFASNSSRPMEVETIVRNVEKLKNATPLVDTLNATVAELERYLGGDTNRWQLSRVTALMLKHPLNKPEWNRGPIIRDGDPNTINASGGGGNREAAGPSYRQVIDLADWDRSTMTNIPGEVGDPRSKHYADLIEDWSAARYHPMPYTRKAVEAVTEERIMLKP